MFRIHQKLAVGNRLSLCPPSARLTRRLGSASTCFTSFQHILVEKVAVEMRLQAFKGNTNGGGEWNFCLDQQKNGADLCSMLFLKNRLHMRRDMQAVKNYIEAGKLRSVSEGQWSLWIDVQGLDQHQFDHLASFCSHAIHICFIHQL